MRRSKLHIAAIWTSLVPHIFCCVLPWLVALSNLALGADMAFDHALFHYGFEEFVLALSGVFILASWAHAKAKGYRDKFLPLVVAIHFTAIAIYFIENGW